MSFWHHIPQKALLYIEDTLGCGPDISPDTEDRRCDRTASSLAHRTIWVGNINRNICKLFNIYQSRYWLPLLPCTPTWCNHLLAHNHCMFLAQVVSTARGWRICASKLSKWLVNVFIPSRFHTWISTIWHLWYNFITAYKTGCLAH